MRPFNTPGFVRDEQGGVAVIAAIASTIMVALAAFAVDLGSIFLQARQLQGMADLAAIGAARDLGNAQAAANATAGANGWNGPLTTDVVLGVYTPNPSLAPAQRFTATSVSPNAVQVTMHAKANLFFGASIMGRSTVDISRTATAAQAQLASFSIGSRLLAVQGGVANSALTALTGSSVNLSVMDYNSLASAQINLLQLSQALQTKLNLTGASFSTVLATKMSSGTVLNAVADQLSTNGNDEAASAMRQIATAAGNTTAPLNQVIDLGPYGNQDHADPATGAGVQVDALDLTNAVLQVSQGGHQVQLASNTGVPGLANVNAWLAIGQRPSNSPWLTVNDDKSISIYTVQTRLYVDAQVSPGGNSLLSSVAQVNVPVYVEAASAQAKLSSLTCPSASSTATPAMTIQVQPSIGKIAVGQINTANLNTFTTPMTISPANIATVLGAKVTAQSTVNIGGQDWQSVSFSQSDISSGAVKTVTTNDVASATATSLLSNLQLGVQAGGLNLGLNQLGVTQALTPVVSAAGAPLDTVLNTLESISGVKLGQADVWGNGLRCQDAALVA